MARDRKPELFAPILAEATSSTAKLQMYGRVDPDGAPWGISANEFGDVLAALPDSVDSIDLHIHSRGGDVFDALAIVQQLRDHPATVNATVDGIAASAASFIAISCDTLTMAPDSSLMIHDARALIIDVLTASETQKLQTRLVHANDKMAAMYARKAGGTVAEWSAAMDAESWYSADEAVQAGLADSRTAQLPTESAVAASLDLTTFAYDGREHAPAPFIPAARAATKTPADQPVTPPTDHKEADTMSDTISKAGLVKALSLPADADEDAILDAIDERSKTAANAATDTELAVVKRELETTQAQLRGLTEARQRDEDNAKAAEKARVFAEAFTRGAVHPADHAERVQDEADYDAAPEVMARVLAGRADGSRFPVKPQGYGTDTSTAEAKDDGWFPQFNGTKPRVEA